MKERKSDGSRQLSYRIHTRLTKEKYDELSDLLGQSRSLHSLSELLRNILDNKKIIIETCDVSLNKVMEELSAIRKELQAIGVNINQVTHAFHQTDMQDEKLFQALEIVKIYQQADLKVTELFAIIANLSKKWLPK